MLKVKKVITRNYQVKKEFMVLNKRRNQDLRVHKYKKDDIHQEVIFIKIII